MPRPRNPEGKHVTMSARFSEAEAAEIDAARGDKDRGVWLREAALSVARRPQRKPPPTRGQQARIPAPTPKADPGSPPPQPPGAPRRCTHPGKRIIGGWCKDCDHMIEPGGLWRA